MPAPKTRLAIQGLAIAGGWVPIAIAAGQSVAIRIDSFAGSTTAQYSIVIALGWLVEMIALPFMGRLSDYSTSHKLSRRLMLALGALTSLIAAFALEAVNSVPAFALIWMLAQFPAAFVISVAATNLAAEAADELQGWAAGIAGMAFALSLLVGAITALATSNTSSLLFIAPAIAGAVLVIPACVMKPLEHQSNQQKPDHALAHHPWALLAVIALVFSGVAVGRIYAVPLIEDIAHSFTDKQVTDASSYALIAATLLAFVGNATTGKLIQVGKSPLQVLAWMCAIAALPLIAFTMISSIAWFIAMAGLLGLVIGAVTSAAYAVYLARFANGPDSGRNFGLLTAAETIPYVIVPLIAAGTQEATNSAVLTGLFLIGAVLAVVAGVISITISRAALPEKSNFR